MADKSDKRLVVDSCKVIVLIAFQFFFLLGLDRTREITNDYIAFPLSSRDTFYLNIEYSVFRVDVCGSRYLKPYP